MEEPFRRLAAAPARRTQLAIGLLIAVGFSAWALLAGSQLPSAERPADPDQSDAALYSAILERMAKGESYYDAAVREQVERGYPVQPSAAVRLPTLAVLDSLLGEKAAYVVLISLVVLVLLLATLRFERLARSRVEWVVSLLLLVAGLTLVAAPTSIYFAESWAACLMLLALLVGVSERPRTALALAIGAMLFRELAILFVVGIGMLHLFRRQRVLAVAWWGAAGAFAAGYFAVHAPLVADACQALSLNEPPVSPGWIDFGGWPLVVDFLRRASPFAMAPYAVAVLMAAVSLIGWASRRDVRLAQEFLVASLTFCVPFMVIGRPNTAYWGLLFAAIVLPGAAYAGRALRDLRPNRAALRASEGMSTAPPSGPRDCRQG